MSKLKGDPGYRGGWCIHYRAPPNLMFEPNAPNTCEAGVEYDTLPRPFAQRPCFLDDGKSKPDAVPCAHLRRPTPEEIQLHEEWAEGRMNRLRTVMIGIRSWREAHKGKSTAEVVECPACKGRLHLSISSYNGHVHGHCETEGCVSWME